MAGRIVGAGVDVAGADRGADRAHGGRGGAIGNPLGEVGGDCQRIGGQGGVHVQRRPFRPPAPCRSVLIARAPSRSACAAPHGVTHARPASDGTVSGRRSTRRRPPLRKVRAARSRR